jgi:hypothetical protein
LQLQPINDNKEILLRTNLLGKKTTRRWLEADREKDI